MHIHIDIKKYIYQEIHKTLHTEITQDTKVSLDRKTQCHKDISTS